jgi:hypothetical protein
MQSAVPISRSPEEAAGAPQPAPLNRNANVPNESGNGDQTDGGDNESHVGGRSRVIHALFAGF